MNPQRSQRATKLTLRDNPDSDDSISDDDDVDELTNIRPNNAFSSLATSNKQKLPLAVRLDFLKGNCNQNLDGKGSCSSLLSIQKEPIEDEVEMPDFKESDFGDISGEVAANSSDEETHHHHQKEPIEDEVEMPDFKESDFGDISGEVVANSSDEETHHHPQNEPIEDEVETPEFKEGEFGDISGEVVANSSDEKTSFEDQVNKFGQFVRNEQRRGTTGNSKPLFRSVKCAPCPASNAISSKANTSGNCSKAKPRFPSRSVSHNHAPIGPSISNIDRLHRIMQVVDPIPSANLDGSYYEDHGRMEINSEAVPAKTETLTHGLNLPSIADLFDKLQDKNDMLFQKSSRSHLQGTVVDGEDSPDSVDSGSSSGNEVNDQHIRITIPGKKMQTMADRFHEAFGSSSIITEGTHVRGLNSLRSGIFGKLQLVMQKEKERDMDFWKKLQAGGELGCVDVKIISRYLDGKLTVCHCSFSKYAENFLLHNNNEGLEFGGSESSQSTIIFNPRVCNNVDLEVGNLIRIYPPWKEVQEGSDNIILCTYFSEISYPV